MVHENQSLDCICARVAQNGPTTWARSNLCHRDPGEVGRSLRVRFKARARRIYLATLYGCLLAATDPSQATRDRSEGAKYLNRQVSRHSSAAGPSLARPVHTPYPTTPISPGHASSARTRATRTRARCSRTSGSRYSQAFWRTQPRSTSRRETRVSRCDYCVVDGPGASGKPAN